MKLKVMMKKQITSSTASCKTYICESKEKIERVLADAKEKHDVRWTALRGFLKNCRFRRC